MMITAGVQTETKLYEWRKRSRSSPSKFELVQSLHNHRLKTRNTASYAQLNGFGLFRCEHRTRSRSNYYDSKSTFCALMRVKIFSIFVNHENAISKRPCSVLIKIKINLLLMSLNHFSQFQGVEIFDFSSIFFLNSPKIFLQSLSRQRVLIK